MAKKPKKESWEQSAPSPSVSAPPAPPPPAPPAKPLATAPLPEDLAKLAVEDLLRVAGALIVFNAKRLYREDGTPISITELDDVTALAIQAIEVDEMWEDGERGEPRINVGVTKKIRQYDRLRAIELYAELKGWKAGKGASEDRANLLREYLAAVREGAKHGPTG